MGVMSFFVTSYSVLAPCENSPLASSFLPILYTFLLISVLWWKPC